MTGWLGPPHLLLQIWAQIGPHTLTRQQENSAEKELFFSLYFLSPLWSYTLYSLSRTFFFHIYLCYFVCFYCLFSPCFLSPFFYYSVSLASTSISLPFTPLLVCFSLCFLCVLIFVFSVPFSFFIFVHFQLFKTVFSRFSLL